MHAWCGLDHRTGGVLLSLCHDYLPLVADDDDDNVVNNSRAEPPSRVEEVCQASRLARSFSPLCEEKAVGVVYHRANGARQLLLREAARKVRQGRLKGD